MEQLVVKAGEKRGVLREQYELLFGRPWPLMTAAVLVAVTNVFLFAFERPWTASDGARNWGDWLLRLLGVIRRPDLLTPWLFSGSILNLGLLAGACAAALLSREFAIRVAPSGELIRGGVGGLLMGAGAVLAFGCNIGGFFSALSALSLSGLAMMVGLGIGAFLGLRYLLWETDRWPGVSAGRSWIWCAPRSGDMGAQPILGTLLLAGLLTLPWVYSAFGYTPQGGFLLFGVAFGVIFQRSRFCMVRAFREPFLTGAGDHTRAAALALAISLLGFSILKFADLRDASTWVFPGFWLGGLLGGILFGVGMVLAGGCGAGSLWRAGEGHVKLWLAVLGFSLGASLLREWLARGQILQRIGTAVFLPAVLGWAQAVSLILGVLAAWYLLAAWNEESRKFSLT
jgi:uncharacterized membrane protein YedE/YeeE